MKQSAKQILEAARALLSDPSHWTQRVSARDSAGLPVAFNEPRACKFCAGGAVAKVAINMPGPEYEQAIAAMYAAAKHDLNAGGLVQVNDYMGYEATLRMFDKAIERL